jgi:hypothetical protein
MKSRRIPIGSDCRIESPGYNKIVVVFQQNNGHFLFLCFFYFYSYVFFILK